MKYKSTLGILSLTAILLTYIFCINIYAQSSKISLDVVPSSLQKEYLEKTGKEWGMSSYDDRKAFWDAWLLAKKKELAEKKITYDEYKQYGEDFSTVPFDIKYMYEKTYSKPWDDASNEEKKAYLLEYKKNKKASDKNKLQEEKAAAKEEKARLKEKMMEKRLIEQKIKAKQRAAEKKRKAEEKKDRDFERMVQKQKRKIEKLRKQMNRSHR